MRFPMSSFHDSQGVPIYPGDLIRTPNFVNGRGVRYYLYHTVVSLNGRLWMIPTSHLEPSKVKGGGDCQVTQAHVGRARVISGGGPGDILDFDDRPKHPAWIEAQRCKLDEMERKTNGTRS